MSSTTKSHPPGEKSRSTESKLWRCRPREGWQTALFFQFAKQRQSTLLLRDFTDNLLFHDRVQSATRWLHSLGKIQTEKAAGT